MIEDARVKRQRYTPNNRLIISISPEMLGRHPVSFTLSTKLLQLIALGVALAIVGLVALSAMLIRNTHAYANMKQINQALYSELSVKEQSLTASEQTLAAMDSSIKSYTTLRQENVELKSKLELTNLELYSSEATVSQMSLSLQELLSQLGQVDGLVQDLQLIAGLEPDSQTLTEVDIGVASGGEQEASFEDLTLGLSSLVGSARTNLAGLSTTISEVRDTVAHQQALQVATPKLWPVEGHISSEFGGRINPISGRKQSHRGMDIVAPYKTSVKVSAEGTVLRAGWSNSGYGNHVLIDHGHGLKTMYAHLNAISVNVGDILSLGDEVGLLGNTGYSTGPHLHYEVWLNDVPTNPRDFLP